jgi:hypothetical protein
MGEVKRISFVADDALCESWLAVVESVRTSARMPISEAAIVRVLVEEFIRAAADHPMGRLFPSFRIVPAGDDATLVAAEPPARAPVPPVAAPKGPARSAAELAADQAAVKAALAKKYPKN